MPLILVGLSTVKATGTRGFERRFWHVIATPRNARVVKQFQPSGDLITQLELAQKAI